jgi:mRNA interferase MazF
MSTISQHSMYWYDGNPGIGSEYQKIRPCIVISPDSMNDNLKTVVVVPITSQIRPWPFRINIQSKEIVGSVACDQIRVIDKQRLVEFISDLEKDEKQLIKEVIHKIYC